MLDRLGGWLSFALSLLAEPLEGSNEGGLVGFEFDGFELRTVSGFEVPVLFVSVCESIPVSRSIRSELASFPAHQQGFFLIPFRVGD